MRRSPTESALVVEEDRGGDQRPGQAAAPRLVGAGDEAVVEPAVEVEEALAAAQATFVELAAHRARALRRAPRRAPR